MPDEAVLLATARAEGVLALCHHQLRRSPAWAPLLPLVALFYVGATVASAWRFWRGKGGQWKARVQAPAG